MANTKLSFLETRTVIKEHWTDIYILATDCDDGTPTGGWYHCTVPPNIPALDALRDALVSMDFLTSDKWSRKAPPR